MARKPIKSAPKTTSAKVSLEPKSEVRPEAPQDTPEKREIAKLKAALLAERPTPEKYAPLREFAVEELDEMDRLINAPNSKATFKVTTFEQLNGMLRADAARANWVPKARRSSSDKDGA